LRWPIVRAEMAQVGSYSLSGLIQDATGFDDPYIADIARGRAGVVIDSLDEAHFKAGTENFLAFIDNVWKVSGSAPSRQNRQPSIILMSRSDTAELVRLAFVDAGIPLAEVKLDFFDQTGAEQFVRSYLEQRFAETHRPEYNIPLASPGPFNRLKNSRLKQVARVLLRQVDVDLRRDWPAVCDFLGYTPVLIAMAESLAVSNPSSEQPSLTAMGQSNLLRDIVEHITSREQRKFSEHMRLKLQAILPAQVDAEVDASTMYRPDEQCARLIALLSGTDLAMSLPVGLPESIRPAYEDAVRTFLPDHPFLKGRKFASVVFGDFVMAAACRSLDIRASLPRRSEETFEVVGPFFTRFLADDMGESAIEIDEGLIELVVESWALEADLVRADESEVVIQFIGGEGSLSCSRDAQSGHEEGSEFLFGVSGVSGALHLRRSVRRAVVITDQGAILGETNRPLTLGPQVAIIANELIIEADVVRIADDRNGGRNVILASELISANYLRKVEGGPKNLHVFSSDAPARLRPWSREMKVDHVYIPYRRYMDLRTILTAFRPSVKGGPSVLAAKIDNKIVKGSTDRAKILQRLIGAGAVSRQGALYHLDLSAIGQLGFSLQDLKSGEPTDVVLSFLRTCMSD
ncbi:MAG: hypothetical protein ACRCYU_12885, partial [Nocardioides sp.]